MQRGHERAAVQARRVCARPALQAGQQLVRVALGRLPHRHGQSSLTRCHCWQTRLNVLMRVACKAQCPRPRVGAHSTLSHVGPQRFRPGRACRDPRPRTDTRYDPAPPGVKPRLRFVWDLGRSGGCEVLDTSSHCVFATLGATRLSCCCPPPQPKPAASRDGACRWLNTGALAGGVTPLPCRHVQVHQRLAWSDYYEAAPKWGKHPSPGSS